MKKKILLFPFGGNAKESLLSILAINKIRETWDVLGFLDDDRAVLGKECCGFKVLGGREVIKKNTDAMVLAVPGNPNTFLKRRKAIESLGVAPARFATIIHPSAVVSPDAKIGINVTLMANVFVSSGVTIGNHCVFLPNTVIAHDSMVGDYCLVGSNITISGNVRIGEGSYIASGTNIRNDIRIGDRSLVGLGSNVVSDVDDRVVVAGNPARMMKSLTEETA
jgi:sugar O-acyltransferase (sialic acid O-acetyltransferase NeuD family)